MGGHRHLATTSLIRNELLKAVQDVLAEATLESPSADWMQKGGRMGEHTEHLSFLLAEMQVLPRTYPDAQW